MATAIAERQKLTPPQLARLWGVDPNKIIGFIKRGELRAMNAAANLGGRARYLIDVADIAEFEARRAVVPPAPITRRKKPSNDGIVRHFRGNA